MPSKNYFRKLGYISFGKIFILLLLLLLFYQL